MPDDAERRGARAAGAATEGRELTIGTWNVSGWSAERLRAAAEDLDVEVLAVQDTQLMPVPL